MGKSPDPVVVVTRGIRARQRELEHQAKKAAAAAKGETLPPPPAKAAREAWKLTALAATVPKCGSRGQPPADFVKWFDALSLADFLLLWNDKGDKDTKTKGARQRIKEEIRKPGGLHEWLKCSQMAKLKEWGVSMTLIKSTAEPTLFVEGMDFLHTSEGGRGSYGSTAMHKELDRMFETSNDFDQFKGQLNDWADRELLNGRVGLPDELQVNTPTAQRLAKEAAAKAGTTGGS
ncbi:MAG: hypothetical protein ABW221_19330 [Vicinamibacteria bacterium]